MRNLWKPSKYRIGGFEAIELKTVCRGLETVEYCLSGPRGEIWEDGRGVPYAAILTHDPKGRRARSEQYIRFGADKLEEMIRLCRVPEASADQTCYANTFGRDRL